MKAYTDLSQNKELAKILSLESANMYYSFDDNIEEFEEDPQVIPQS